VHLVNAYEINAGWLIPFVDKRVGGRLKLCEPRAIQPGCHAAGHCSLSVSVGQTAFHLLLLYSFHLFLEFNVPFQHKYGYIRDERSRMESYPYPVKVGQRYIKLNPCCLFVQQPPKKGNGSRGSFKLLC